METLVSAGELVRAIVKGTEVNTKSCGVDYSGEITVAAQNGDFMIWRKAAGSCWLGRIEDREYVPVEYWLVHIENTSYNARNGSERVTVQVLESIPGKQRKMVQALKAKLAAIYTPVQAQKQEA